MEHYCSKHTLNNGQHLILRMPVIEDAEALMAQMKIIDCETKFLAREPGEFDLTLEQEQAFIRRSIDDENSLFIIGQVADEIVANCSVGLISSRKRYRHRAALGIGIKKAYWHKGIGKKMIQTCIDWCKEKGVEQLELEVVTENERALALYQSLGFQIYGTNTSNKLI